MLCLQGSGLLPTSNIGATWDAAAEWPNCAPSHAAAFPKRAAAHGDDAAPLRRLRAISIMIGVIPAGGRTRSRHPLSAGTWFTAPSSITVASCGVLRAVGPNWTRQWKSWPVPMQCSAKQPQPATLGFSFSCTVARFCSSVKR